MKCSGLYFLLFFASTLIVSCSNDSDDKDSNSNTSATPQSANPSTATATVVASVAKEKIPDAKTQGLKGKVEVLSEALYNVGESGKKLSYKNVFKYDANGNTTELANYSSDGKLKSTIKSSYDANGNLVGEQTLMGDGTVDLTSTIKVDAKGNRIEQADVRPNSNNPLFNLKHFFTYDEKGQLRERSSFKGSGTLAFKYIFNYDDQGNKIEWIQIAPNGVVNGKVNYKYDDKNYMIEETVYGSKGELKSTFTYTYDYDKKGNWTRRTKMLDGKPVEIKERQITYD
jgi:hypothetical protein